METLNQFLPVLELLGFIVMTGVVLFMRGKSGATTVSQDIITTYKTRVEQLESNEKEYKQRQNEHTKEIGNLQGVLAEKEKEINRMRTMLENRDPELMQLLKDIKNFMVQVDSHMQAHTRILEAGVSTGLKKPRKTRSK